LFHAAISEWRRRLSAHGGHFEHVRGVYMDQCVKLMLRMFEFGVLLFDCFVYRQNVTRLKRFNRYGHYAGEAEDLQLITRKVITERNEGRKAVEDRVHHVITDHGVYGLCNVCLRGSVVERWSLTSELSLSCARPAADG